MKDYSQIVSEIEILEAKKGLESRGFEVFIVENKEEAKQKTFELVPEGSQVMNMTSETLIATGIQDEILNSGRYEALGLKVRDDSTPEFDKRAFGAAPDFVVGSVHAITQDGSLFIASATGSQLPAYAYGAKKVVFVAGAQKIVKDQNEAMERLEGYVLPLESERAKKAYGVPGSAINKLLILHREVSPARISVVIVKENLGF